MSFVSPSVIGDLPLEVLQHILLFTCEDWYFIQTSKPTPPYQHHLLAVCHRWKDAALSFPALWCNIRINHKEKTLSPQRLEHLFRCLRIAIQCTRGSLMMISLWISPYHIDSHRPMTPLLRELIKTSSQWTHITLHTPSSRIFRSLRHNIPELRSLDVMFSGHAKLTLSKIFSDAPKLTDVIIRLKDRYVLPWSQLRRVEFRYAISAKSTYHLNLTESSQMRYFMWYAGCGDSLDVPASHPPITLPLVEAANISSSLLLARLTLPVLERLTISVHTEQPDELAAFQETISRSRCTIHSLVITSFVPFRAFAVPWDPYLPGLVSLNVSLSYDELYDDTPTSERICAELATFRTLFLKLEELSILILWNGEGNIWDEIWELVSLRTGTLKRLEMKFDVSSTQLDAGSFDGIEALQKLRELDCPVIDVTVMSWCNRKREVLNLVVAKCSA